jgi:DNA-binding NarL/FixJ family response regulator
MTAGEVRVMIADDHPVFRDGLAGMVDAIPACEWWARQPRARKQ